MTHELLITNDDLMRVYRNNPALHGNADVLNLLASLNDVIVNKEENAELIQEERDDARQDCINDIDNALEDWRDDLTDEVIKVIGKTDTDKEEDIAIAIYNKLSALLEKV